MAINTTFNGATIFKPGAYSRTNIDLGGGFPIGPAGLIAVIGEADAGAPGSQEINLANNRFTADQIVPIRDKYRSGPIADASSMLFAPSVDPAIPSGAQTVWFWKTNQSTQASLSLASAYGTVTSREWGVGGNRITYESVLVAETTASTTSSAAFDETTLTPGDSFDLYVDGMGPNTWTVPAGITNNAALDTELNNTANWSGGLPTDVTITIGGADTASTVTFSQNTLATANQLGWGRSFELTENTNTPLANMNISPAMYSAAVEPSATITIQQKRDLVSESEEVGGNVVLAVGRDTTGAPTSASVSVDDEKIELKENAAVVYTFFKESFATMLDLVEEINLSTYAGWTAELTSTEYNQLPAEVLDEVTDVGALSPTDKPARIKKDSDDVASYFELSSTAYIQSQAAAGLPDAETETPLAGGTRGATTPADIIEGLEKFQKFHVNSIVPLFSRDATADIADGLTDSGSTYTIAGIHQAIKTHISLMKTTKKRSERQGYLSIKDSYAASKTQAGVLADGRLQLAIQDTRNVDAQGNIKWFQPWSMAATLAGARAGAPIGEPMTFKFMNVSGIRHTAQPMSTADEDITIDFDPDLQTDDAIQSGLTFMEAPQTGGFRVVVDNTTYGRDANWVWNRSNVIYAADIVAFNFRNALEARFVGRKNTVSAADVSGFATTILTNFLNQGITVSTADAPQGFKSLVVRIEGNTIFVECIIKLVEGIDFVLADITVQRATSEA